MNATLLLVGLALLAADPAPQSKLKNRFTDANEGVAGSSRFESGAASPAVPLDADDDATDRFGARTTIPDNADFPAKRSPVGNAEPLVPVGKGNTATEQPEDVTPPEKKLTKKPKGKLAALVLAQALKAPDKEALAGRPLSLEQAFSLAVGPLERIGVAATYWKLSAATADYHLAIRHHERLGELQKLVEQHGRQGDAALFAAEMTAGAARVYKTQFEAVTAQHQLATRLRQPTADSLPLAEDLPLAAAYRTSFASIFATRPAPARARMIDRTLPIRLQEINARADAVLAADEAFRSQQEAYRLGQIYLPAVLSADASLRGQWRQFAAAVYAYNRDILEYAGMVGGSTASDASLVGMLIDVETKTAPRWMPRQQPTLAEPLRSVLRRK